MRKARAAGLAILVGLGLMACSDTARVTTTERPPGGDSAAPEPTPAPEAAEPSPSGGYECESGQLVQSTSSLIADGAPPDPQLASPEKGLRRYAEFDSRWRSRAGEVPAQVRGNEKPGRGFWVRDASRPDVRVFGYANAGKHTDTFRLKQYGANWYVEQHEGCADVVGRP